MSYAITKRFSFAASHSLPTLPDTHKCHRLHGHNYEVEVRLESHVTDENGFVLDYGDLDPFRTEMMRLLDHRHLNDVLAEDYPWSDGHQYATAEALARWLGGLFMFLYSDHPEFGNVGYGRVQLDSVTVKETPNTSAVWFA